MRLSLRDYFQEKLLSFCAIMGLAAVLAPLLVLFGLKNGIINSMSQRLIQDPRNLEISPVGSGRYTQQWLDALTQRPDVAFAIFQTRSIAANMILKTAGGKDAKTVVVDLIPTDTGDPLIEKYGKVPRAPNQVALSESVARKLKATPGQRIQGMVGRSVSGVKEHVTIELTVVSVLPPEAFLREAAFVRLSLLKATEDYRDGYQSPDFGWPGKVPQNKERFFPSFRLYARTIYDVMTLRDLLADQGLEVYARADEIEVVQHLDRSFSLIFSLITIVAVFGYFASMASNVLANVNRKSKYLGITRLIGFSTGSLVWFPVIQSAATSLFGTASAMGFYFVVQVMINRGFGKFLAAEAQICRISLLQLVVALVLTVFLSMLASAFAAFRASKIEPSEVIRDV